MNDLLLNLERQKDFERYGLWALFINATKKRISNILEDNELLYKGIITMEEKQSFDIINKMLKTDKLNFSYSATSLNILIDNLKTIKEFDFLENDLILFKLGTTEFYSISTEVFEFFPYVVNEILIKKKGEKNYKDLLLENKKI